jgi:hypothetical protein
MYKGSGGFRNSGSRNLGDKMFKNNLVSLWLVVSGMTIACWMSIALDPDQLPLLGSLVGASLARWYK